MASSSTAVSNYDRLASQSMRSLDGWERSTPETSAIFAQKNFFGTLQDAHGSSLAGKGFRRGEHNRSGFGSPYLYLKLLRSVVSDLLTTTQIPASSREFKVMREWLNSTELTLETAAIVDYLCGRIPGCISTLLSGQNPKTSWLFRILYPLGSPNESVLTMISDRIMHHIYHLQRGTMFAVPGGTVDHETIYCVRKNLKGAVSVWEIEPGMGTG